MKLRKRFFLPLVVVACLVGVRTFLPDAWGELTGRASGKATVSSVTSDLEPRMRAAFPDLASLTDGKPIALLGFKEERRLELWKEGSSGWRHVKSYPFTGFSGKLGPKLREGDGQIPEGVYKIEYLNPNSSYHLSMKIDYPNAFDKEMGKADGRVKLGYDIFLHGKSVTIGCIPLGDPGIEEVFYLVAKNGRANTKVVIAPWDFRVREDAPEIEGVDWEGALYGRIRAALVTFRIPVGR